jgi:hypothetical protein
MNQIVDDARRFAAVADMKVSDMSANAPVGTTLAILERMLKVMSAVQARLHYTLKQELKLLANIIRDYTAPDYDYEADGPRGAQAKRSDYSNVEVIPVSDPNAATMSQRVVQYQAVMQMAQAAPQIYDLPQLHRQMLDVLGVKHADKLVPTEDDMKPVDPVTENMNLMKMKPVKAFITQDHEAHIAVHMAAMQDPKIMQVVGQNPQAQAMMAAAHAHIAEHLGFAYRQKVEQQLGVPLPAPDQPQNPEVEAQLAPLIAQAAQQLLMNNQKEVAQKQAQQAAQDPMVQMEMQKLQLEGKKVAIQEQKLKVDAAAKTDQLDIERERIAAQERIAGMQAGVKAQGDKLKMQHQQEAEGVRMGVDIAKHKAQLAHQSKQNANTAQPSKKETD